MSMSDFIVHYSRGEPFRSISSVSSEKIQSVLSELGENNTWGLSRFSDPDYLPRRMEVEKKIREELMVKGGKPVLAHPLHFFLGRNSRFEENKKNVGYKINLKDIPPTSVSFTYGDSMFALNEDYRIQLGGEYLSEPCSRVYLLEELGELFLAIDHRPDRLHIECQLWIEPNLNFLSQITKES